MKIVFNTLGLESLRTETYVQAILSAIPADEAKVLAAARLDGDTVQAERIPLWETYKLWDAAKVFNDGPVLGFVAAEQLEIGALGIVEYICRNSQTVGDALQALCDHINLLNDSLLCVVYQDEKTTRLIPWVLHTAEGLHPQGGDFFSVFLMRSEKV